MTCLGSNLLWRDRRGLALVEFALVLPVMLTLFLGGFQLTQASACQRRVTIVARAIADIVSRNDVLTVTKVATILSASSDIMAPYDVSVARSRVSLVKVDGNLNVTVMWSEARNTVQRDVGPFAGLPADMKIANSYYVLGEVSYDYRPISGRFAWPISFTQTLYMVPRKSAYVDCPTCVA
ncbi:TadE/TadG family type IV pilus assembly protein [Sphingomonas sp. 1P08PE]|uniref:TadE/TadG family type IV pilus assembly protein n=1 Tax=Sphingomonas sp. 1P08PE TaxID=554122 RepID=UPI0039A06778